MIILYTQNDIEYLKNLILDTMEPEKIILFGSYAYGVPTEESDIDLLVIMPVDNLSLSEGVLLTAKVNTKEMFDKTRPYITKKDICVVDQTDVRELCNDKDSCIYDALRKGKVIYI